METELRKRTAFEPEASAMKENRAPLGPPSLAESSQKASRNCDGPNSSPNAVSPSGRNGSRVHSKLREEEKAEEFREECEDEEAAEEVKARGIEVEPRHSCVMRLKLASSRCPNG